MFKTYFLDVITKHYVDFAGRADRKQFWLFVLFNLIIGVVLSWLTIKLNIAVIYWLYFVALLLPGLAIGARRLHDIGRSAWWLLLLPFPPLNLVLLVFFLLPSKK